MSGWNKLNIAQATTSDLTCLKSWDLEKTAFKEIQFPKRETGLPRQMVNPTLLCSYAFFSLESYNRFRLRKINQIMKKQWKRKTRRTSVRMSADWFWSARRDKQVLLTNFHVHFFPVGSKLSELQPQTWNICFIWVIVFILGHLVNWILTNFFFGKENITILHWNKETFRDESLKNQQLVDVN